VTGLAAEKCYVIDSPWNDGHRVREPDLGLEVGASGGKWASLVEVGGDFQRPPRVSFSAKRGRLASVTTGWGEAVPSVERNLFLRMDR
jgi:hypothetical protein